MGSIYKCFTSTSTFFHSICDTVNFVTYKELLQKILACKFDLSASSMLNNTMFILFTFCFGN